MKSLLYVRSVYSLLSSMCSVEDIISKCLEYGYTSCALVDKNVLAGAMVFKKACQANNIKPIYGLEVDTLCNGIETPVMLLSKNDEGFRNLMKLSSLICTQSDKVIGTDVLKKYSENNVIVLFSDTMPLRIALEKKSDSSAALKLEKELFGEYVVALCDHDIAYNLKYDKEAKEILRKENIFSFALNRAYYPDKGDEEEYEVLKCIRDKKTIKDINNSDEAGRYILNPSEFESLYEREELENTDALAATLNVEMAYHTSLPVYQSKDGISSKDYLVNLSKAGLSKRLHNTQNKEYLSRLEYELKVIMKMNLEDYFLIVYDFILFAKRNGIMVGPGRGSAAGSMVAYCLGITDIDPIKYGLLFERFLNPERISLPDIDTDFPDDRRSEVFEYVQKKYGKEHVGHIITYGTLKPKQVLRDVGRVLEYSTSDIDSLTKLIPFAYDMSLEKAYEGVPVFRQKIESEAKFRKLYKIALKIEGAPRHESTHAAGVVMSRLPISDVAPVIAIEDDYYSTQYTMEHLEELGLIKMDFLGLRNLGIIAEIVEDIKKFKPDFSISHIALDDKKTFDLIDSVNVLGVFQLESNGMQSLIRKMKPETFEEIGMTIALFRPGPMENIPLFLENRAHPEKVEYLVKELKPILAETYGVIVYQEQIMSIARTLAGFSYGKADILRRAMSKKKASELEKLANDFIEGCVNNGYTKDIAIKLYELILKFANYGFNKSHSIAYAMVAYEMAYLKANYPLYFYKALLNGVIGSSNKTYEYIHECISVGQKVSGVSINSSLLEYTIKNSAIVMPFGVIKDVGNVSGMKIVNERNANGPFKDYLECITRLYNAAVERNVIENLIVAGALDELGLNRFAMIKALENALRYAENHAGMSLDLGYDDAPVIENYKDDKKVLAEKEKDVLGFYFSYNPIIELKKEYGINTQPLNVIGNTPGIQRGFGLVRRVKQHKTKKGQMMAFVDISDDTGDMSLAVMPDLYAQLQLQLKEDSYIYFEGNIEKENSALVKKARIIGGKDA